MSNYSVIKSLFFVSLGMASTAYPASIPSSSAPPSSVQIWDSLNSKPKLKAIILKPVEIAGFTIINEYDNGEITEFMLTRYPGGCIHVPLPPASSIIHVVMEKGKSTPTFFGKRVIVHGTLKPGPRIDAGFEMIADSVKQFPL